jgi:hypothetical protein
MLNGPHKAQVLADEKRMYFALNPRAALHTPPLRAHDANIIVKKRGRSR